MVYMIEDGLFTKKFYYSWGTIPDPSFAKKICNLAKKMKEEEYFDDLRTQYYEMEKIFVFPVEKTLKNKIRIVMIPAITIVKKKDLDYGPHDSEHFEMIKPLNIKKKIEKHISKNALNFAETIFDAYKNADNKTYTLLRSVGGFEEQVSFKMSATFENIPKVGYALVVDIDKVSNGKSQQKKIDELYKEGTSLMKKAYKTSEKEDFRNFYRNIRHRIIYQKMNDADFWKIVKESNVLKSKNLNKIIEKLEKMHNQLSPSKMIPIFTKDDIENLTESINSGSDTWGEGEMGKLRIRNLYIDIFPELKYIRSRK